MLPKLAWRLVTETYPPALARFAWSFGLKGLVGMARFKRRARRGDNFPAVLFISVTNKCNLSCQGCWVADSGPGRAMPAGQLDGIISAAKKRGSWFFGILGGEPLMYGPLWDVLRRHRDCYFQVFTNGTLLTGSIAREMRRLGNVTPLVSIEGLAETSDVRRGGRDVYARSLAAVDHCRRNGLLTGVATSVCRSNFHELVTDEFVDTLISRGVHYLWYYIYRPVGPKPTPALALSREEIIQLRRFMVDARCRKPLLIVDAYWDHAGRALCPAAAGISYHVNPFGDVEPCPPIQFAADSLAAGSRDTSGRDVAGRDVCEVINRSSFLRSFSEMAPAATRGCVLMERPDLLRQFVIDSGARDSSGRGTALAELAASQARASHDMPGCEIPERHWLYKFVKKNWFFGLGTYG